MNLTTPTALGTPLMGAESSSSNEQKNAILNPAAGEKSLNTKEFADVMDAQQSHHKVSASAKADKVLGEPSQLDTSPIATSALLPAESEAADFAVAGNVFPVAGDSLPPLPEDAMSGESIGDTDSALLVATKTAESGQESAWAMWSQSTAATEDGGFDGEGGNGGQMLAGSMHIQSPAQPAADSLATSDPQPALADAVLSAETPSSPFSGSQSLTSTRSDNINIAEPLSAQPTLVSKEVASPLSASAVAASVGLQPPRSMVEGGLRPPGQVNSEATAKPFSAAQLELQGSSSMADGLTAPDQFATLFKAVTATEGSTATTAPSSRSEIPSIFRTVTETAAQPGGLVDVAKPGWTDTVMQRVMWMSSQQINKAEIALDPPELGSLQVRISTQSDQTSVVFSSQHSVVRDALDQGLPRLREMLESQGLNLSDVDVSGQGAEQHSQARSEADESGFAQKTSGNSRDEDSSATPGEALVTVSSNLVDDYA